MNLNKVFLIGRLTADPQLRTTTSGQSVSTFGLATNRIWTGKDGQRQQETQFHNIVVWGRQAEVANQFLRKGSMALIEGRLQTRSWQDSQGQNRRTTEIICERVQFGPRAGAGRGEAPGQETPSSGEGTQEGSQEGGSQPKSEDLPEINIDDEEIKPEDIPF